MTRRKSHAIDILSWPGIISSLDSACFLRRPPGQQADRMMFFGALTLFLALVEAATVSKPLFLTPTTRNLTLNGKAVQGANAT